MGRDGRDQNLENIPSRVHKKIFPLGFHLRGNLIQRDLVGQWLQFLMFLFGRLLWESSIGQWLQTVSNIKHT